jgi:hypothetical protein
MSNYKQKLFGDKNNMVRGESYYPKNILKHPFLFALEIIAIAAVIAKFVFGKQLLEMGFSADALGLSTSVFILAYGSINFLRAALVYFEKKQ